MIRFIAKQKFRLDLGGSFLSYANFGLLVFSQREFFSNLTGLPEWVVVPCAGVAAVSMVWLGGYTLDRMRFWHEYQQVQNDRNEMLKQALRKD